MKTIKKITILITSSLILIGCDSSHSIPDGFFKDKNWTVWKSEDNNIAIYVASTYGAKNGIWIKGEDKLLVDMDSYLGISGINRPWELKLTDASDSAFQKRYNCQRVKKDKDDSASKFSVEIDSETIVLKSYEWKEEDIDINYLKSIGNEELDLYCTIKVDSTDYSNGYCLAGTYLDDTLLIKGESNRSFVISYKDHTCSGHYSRKGDKLDFQFETNEIFDSLDHIEFNC